VPEYVGPVARFARNVNWTTRKALGVLTRNYGPDVKFASVKVNVDEDWLEIALFAGLLTQEEADRAMDMARRGRIYLVIPNARAGEVDPTVMEP
jgi:hypothetical protein